MPVRLLRSLVAIVLAGALGACTLMSKNPAGPEAAAVFDADLYGSWMNVNEGSEIAFLHVFPRSERKDKLLTIIFAGGGAEDGGWYALDGHVTALADGRRYLNLKLVTSTHGALAKLDLTYADRDEYPYGYLPYRVVDGDRLQFGAPPMEEVSAAVKAGTLAGAVIEEGIPIVKVDDTSDKIAAVLAAQDEAKAFTQPLEFTRIKAPPPAP